MEVSPRHCWWRATARRNRYLVCGACLLAATLSAHSGSDPVGPDPTPVDPVCLATGNGYLKARLGGEINTEINWANAGTACEGMPRPDGRGLRLSFARVLGPDGHRLVIVFGVAHVGENESGKALPVNVTVIVEGASLIYGTRGDDKCIVDRLRSQPLASNSKARIYRVEARGGCTQPARAVNGPGAVLISTFDFAGQVSFDAATPRPPGQPGLTS